MCCFSRPVRFVGGTNIFARGLPSGQQLLVYAMNVELDEELAMILPLPVALPAGERDVTFFNLEGEERLFTELNAAFPPLGPQPLARSPVPIQAAKLEVLDVGAYVASFVPSPADFARLDERFRLPSGFLAALPRYADYGFAVFQLKPKRGFLGGRKRQAVQPMALSFPRREARSLFFPTVHVHDGQVPRHAQFDHALYCQVDGVLERTLGWERSNAPLGQHVTGVESRKLIDAASGGSATSLWGELSNDDVWLREPAGVAIDDLSGRGERYEFQLSATAAYAFSWEGTQREPWMRSASTHFAELCRGVRQGLAQLTEARKLDWRLTPLHAQLPLHFMNGPQLWTGTNYMNGRRAEPGGPGQVRFNPFSDLVEPQSVTLGFEQLPTPELTAAIHAELSRLLDRLVST